MISRNLFLLLSEVMDFTAWAFKRLVISLQNNVKSPVPNPQNRISGYRISSAESRNLCIIIIIIIIVCVCVCVTSHPKAFEVISINLLKFNDLHTHRQI
jgi:hypothetical protein